jgi:hypothetical protein
MSSKGLNLFWRKGTGLGNDATPFVHAFGVEAFDSTVLDRHVRPLS